MVRLYLSIRKYTHIFQKK